MLWDEREKNLRNQNKHWEQDKLTALQASEYPICVVMQECPNEKCARACC